MLTNDPSDAPDPGTALDAGSGGETDIIGLLIRTLDAERAGAGPPQPRRFVYRVAYLPEAQYAAAWQQELLDATMYPRHEDYRKELQQTLESMAGHGWPIWVVPLDVAGLLDYAAAEGRDPASRATRLAYNASLDKAGRDIAWPPERNAHCWCGSGRKYKKCCGAPGFLAVELYDPASMVLKIELDLVTPDHRGAQPGAPSVWRRIAAPSNMTLDQLHRVIQEAMGWAGDYPYAYESEDVVIVDPRLDSTEIKADGERLVSLANETGQRFIYVYYCDGARTHTVTLEEIRAAGPENIPEILDGAGTCPAEDDETVKRLGADDGPIVIRIPSSNEVTTR